MDTKKCKKCGKDKSLDQYQNNPQTKSGKGSRCNTCLAEDIREKRKNPDYKGRFKLWAFHSVLARYGLTEDTYNSMLKQQHGKCAICGTTEPGGYGNRLHIDHNHETGEVRGLLCNSCNNGLGRFKHKPNILLRAMTYLQGHRIKPPN
jgi:hypothetical protein